MFQVFVLSWLELGIRFQGDWRGGDGGYFRTRLCDVQLFRRVDKLLWIQKGNNLYEDIGKKGRGPCGDRHRLRSQWNYEVLDHAEFLGTKLGRRRLF